MLPDQETYRRALRGMQLSKALSSTYSKLLRAHHAAPDHTLTTLELAAAMDWDTHSPVNAHYGTFARKLAERMRWTKQEGRPEADAIVTFGDGGPEDPHARWIMHPPLARALEELRIVQASSPGVERAMHLTSNPLSEAAPRFLVIRSQVSMSVR